MLCVTLFPFVIFSADLKGFSHTLCHIICMCMLSVLCLIILICVELKFITDARIEVITHSLTMFLVFYTVAVVNIGCREGKNCGRLVAAAFVTVVLAF